jgi:hypothetical protein
MGFALGLYLFVIFKADDGFRHFILPNKKGIVTFVTMPVV